MFLPAVLLADNVFCSFRPNLVILLVQVIGWASFMSFKVGREITAHVTIQTTLWRTLLPCEWRPNSTDLHQPVLISSVRQQSQIPAQICLGLIPSLIT